MVVEHFDCRASAGCVGAIVVVIVVGFKTQQSFTPSACFSATARGPVAHSTTVIVTPTAATPTTSVNTAATAATVVAVDLLCEPAGVSTRTFGPVDGTNSFFGMPTRWPQVFGRLVVDERLADRRRLRAAVVPGSHAGPAAFQGQQRALNFGVLGLSFRGEENGLRPPLWLATTTATTTTTTAAFAMLVVRRGCRRASHVASPATAF